MYGIFNGDEANIKADGIKYLSRASWNNLSVLSLGNTKFKKVLTILEIWGANG